METYAITKTQAGYLSEVARLAARYRETLNSLTRYAERELDALNAGYMGSGVHYQLMGEVNVHQSELRTAVQMNRYALTGLDPEYREELLQLAATGKETFFMPADV
jgi:hypothetical protein